uniref:histidine kinase n=1 Tax=Albugo laibachii Nc14 TaxID=890382 RepID=F0WJK2_9STRA|nr:hybrid signal transduction histidine kinase putative [Albugo laibachii Nc14]|eukprot:CCA21451.1 hybrid signal transduction histidine kinase putative [Albugo laibachii Nc14]
MLSNLQGQPLLDSAQAKIDEKAIKSIYSVDCVHAILNTAMVPAFTIDMNGIIQFWSFSLRNLTGWSEHLVTQQDIKKYTTVDGDNLVEYLKAADTNDVQSGIMIHFNRKNAEEGTLAFTVKLVALRESGKLNGICGIVCDEKTVYGEENHISEHATHQIVVPMIQSEPKESTRKRNFTVRCIKSFVVRRYNEFQLSGLEFCGKDMVILKTRNAPSKIGIGYESAIVNPEIPSRRLLVTRKIIDLQHRPRSHPLKNSLTNIVVTQTNRLWNGSSLHHTTDNFLVEDGNEDRALIQKALDIDHGISSSPRSNATIVVNDAVKRTRNDQVGKSGVMNVFEAATHQQKGYQGCASSFDAIAALTMIYGVSFHESLNQVLEYDKRGLVRNTWAWNTTVPEKLAITKSRKSTEGSQNSIKEVFAGDLLLLDFLINGRSIKKPFSIPPGHQSLKHISRFTDEDFAQEKILIDEGLGLTGNVDVPRTNAKEDDIASDGDRNAGCIRQDSHANVNDPAASIIKKNAQNIEHLSMEIPQSAQYKVRLQQDNVSHMALEREFCRIFDYVNAPSFGVDINGRINLWNIKAAELTQHPACKVFGEIFVDNFITGECRGDFAEVFTRAMNGDDTTNYKLYLVTIARPVSVFLNVTARYDQFGELCGVIAIGQGTAERVTQEHEYSRLIDTANAPIFGVDTNGCVTIWNKTVAEITQYSSSEVMDKKLERFIMDDYKAAVGSVLEKAFDGVETANFEFSLISKLGRRVDILMNATSRFDEHGHVVGMVGIGQDISNRIAQEHEYSRLIDTANAPIFGVDASMCVNIWNKKAAQITNYSINEVMGENLVETFISPEYRPIVADVLSKALKGIQTANFEFPLITRPGTRIEILLNATPRMDSIGNIVGVVGIGQDITDRIAQEHEYFHLIDTANAPIFGVDKNGNINEWNQKIEQITGYTKSCVLGLSLVNTFVIPESRMQVRQLLYQALTGVDVGEMELPMTTKKGHYLLLLVNASSKKDMHGNIRGAIGVGQDYTARKHMEEVKVHFLASFSHELRTPLNSILGMLELLKDKRGLDKDSERHVHMAYVSGSLLLNLINDILDLSKIETGHMEITAAPFHMNDLLDYSIEIFQFKARERNILLQQECSDDVPKLVIGDVVRLRQILLNLLSNAIKFTSEGSITVACSVVDEPALPPQFKKLLFQVIDTGVGMDVEDRSRLFCLFSKLERTRPNNPTGSGLGLAICKQLVELMDGAIDVASELNQGSNFYFTVIVRLLDEEQLILHRHDEELYSEDIDLAMSKSAASFLYEDEQHASNVQIDCSSSIGSMSIPVNAARCRSRILVVEDNEFNWEVVKCYLQEDDHLLQWEPNGQQAVQAYAKQYSNFDMIFMDCEMPLMDGYTATRLIRQFEAEYNLPRVPILGLTAYAMSGDRQKCVDAGMDEFIVKPISKVTLRKAVRHWRRAKYFGLDTQSDIFRPNCSTFSHGQKETKTANTNFEPYTKSKCDALRVTSIASPRKTGSSLARATLSPSPKYPVAPHVALCDGKKLYRRTEPLPGHSGPGLIPASSHMQQLDLANAISSLEVDNPLASSQPQRATYSFRTGVNSIFSCGSSTTNQSLSLRSSLGDSSFYPTWKTQRDSIVSATLPATFHDIVDNDIQEEEKNGEQKQEHAEVEQMVSCCNESQRPRARQHSDRGGFLGRARNKVRRQKSHRRMSFDNNPTLRSHPPAPSKKKYRDRAQKTKLTTFGSVNDILMRNHQHEKQSRGRARHRLQAHNPNDQVRRYQDAAGPTSHNNDISRLQDQEISLNVFLDSPANSTINPLDISIPEGDPINYALGVEQCGGHEDLFVNLLEKFWVNCDQIMTRIESSYQSRDFLLIQRDAHTLKGSSAYVAALRISKVAFRLQVACEHAITTTTTLTHTSEHEFPILHKTYELLRKEHRLLCGYFKRNFAFAAAPTPSSQVDNFLEQRPDEKQCVLM